MILRNIFLSAAIALTAAMPMVAVAEPDSREAERYTREAEQYQRQARRYQNEAEQYQRQAERYLNEAAQYVRSANMDRAQTQIGYARTAIDNYLTYRRYADNEQQKADESLRRARNALR